MNSRCWARLCPQAGQARLQSLLRIPPMQSSPGRRASISVPCIPLGVLPDRWSVGPAVFRISWNDEATAPVAVALAYFAAKRTNVGVRVYILTSRACCLIERLPIAALAFSRPMLLRGELFACVI